MGDRRSARARKAIDYTKFGFGDSDNDDDFQEKETSSNKRKKVETSPKSLKVKLARIEVDIPKKGSANSDSKHVPFSENSSCKKRVSVNDKVFQRQLNTALEISKKQARPELNDSDDQRHSGNGKPSESGYKKHSDSEVESNSNSGDSSDSGEEKHSGSEEEKHSDSEEEKHSDSKEEKHSDSEEEKHSDSEDEKNSDFKDKKHSDSRNKKNSDSGGEKHLDSGDERHSDSRGKKHSDSRGKKHANSGDEKHSDSESEEYSDSEDEDQSDSEYEGESDFGQQSGSENECLKPEMTKNAAKSCKSLSNITNKISKEQCDENTTTKANGKAKMQIAKTKMPGMKSPQTIALKRRERAAKETSLSANNSAAPPTTKISCKVISSPVKLPAKGLRLGLSRKVGGKPLHSTIKVQI